MLKIWLGKKIKAKRSGMQENTGPLLFSHYNDVLLFAGEIKLSTIQKNVKRLMREEFSLFSLGIGFDVDYDFLERIAMENRGMAQRIYANHDAAEQLRVLKLSLQHTTQHI